jgi:Mg-chelatase subunit ChlD
VSGFDGDDLSPRVRWRLVLGESGHAGLGAPEMGPGAMAADDALGWLYDREGDRAARNIAPGRRGGGDGESALSVPDWLDAVHRLFPRETIERLERDAVERYGITEVVTNPEVLARVQPSEALLRAVLRTKHLMNPDLLIAARALVAKVVHQLMEKLATEVRRSFSGTPDRRRRSFHPYSRNFDAARSLRANLRYYDAARRQVLIAEPWFFSRSRRHSSRWQVILLVDQSGSMVSSVIHSAVTAACLWGLPSIRTHLVAFDTAVVDLTQDVTDPVELLMKVQLGGGTNIARAVGYAADLVDAPRRAIVVIISDFYEGGGDGPLVRRVESLVGQGTRVLCLAALDEEARPDFNRETARRLVDAGARVGAMTPGELAMWIAEVVGG